MMTSMRSLGAALLTLTAISTATADERIDFRRDVAPIFAKHCQACHGAEKQESGFRLDQRSALLRGGDFGEPAVTPGAPTKSFLLTVLGEDGDISMPPEGPRLSEMEIGTLRRWIQQGATTPADMEVEADSQTEHWSLQPLARPKVTPARGDNSPIDYFIRRRLEQQQLSFSPPAPRTTLIRRLYLIMLGVPPTPHEVARFVNDQRPGAWERLVDRVLANPHYGERWAQHWLDVIRFGETHGFETNRERPHAWRYRDWVINAFNSDSPYDRFVREQIAGDALGAPVGTGFLVAGPYDLVKSPDINLTLMQRQDELADVINATSSAFLGLTVGCARCHNHKFDPITQVDYYSIQAVFAGLQHADRKLPRTGEQKQRLAELKVSIAGVRKQLEPFLPNAKMRPAVNSLHNIDTFPPVLTQRVRFIIEATNSSQPCLDELEVFAVDDGRNVALQSSGAVASSSSNLPGYPIHQLEHVNDGRYGNKHSWISNESGGGWVEIRFAQPTRVNRVEWARDREGRYRDRIAVKYRIEAATVDGEWNVVASSESRQPFRADAESIAYDFANRPSEEAARGRRLKERLDSLVAQSKRLGESQLAYVGVFKQPGPTHRLYRGEPLAKREEVSPNVISALGDLELAGDAPEQQRRLAFARWASDRRNPLTARTIVNRLWQHHFGVGLAATPSDLGASGAAPTHAELIDWLALELVENGWSLKHIHREILRSRAWRQDSRPNPDAQQVDAGARLLWRFPPRRLEAEAIRDAMLTVSGDLNRQMFGKGFSGFEVQLENVRHYFPKTKFGPTDWRRMVYMTKVRQERESVFGVFDCPDASQLAPVRSRSTTPLQALNLLNSSFVLDQADRFAQRLQQRSGTVESQIADAYQLCYSRTPKEQGMADAKRFIAAEGLAAFCRAILNSNEFLYIP